MIKEIKFLIILIIAIICTIVAYSYLGNLSQDDLVETQYEGTKVVSRPLLQESQRIFISVIFFIIVFLFMLFITPKLFKPINKE